MTNEKRTKLIKHLKYNRSIGADYLITNEDVDEIIKALEQQSRDCKTCKHSDNGNCAGTEECHECMWESKYEQQPCDDCISRADVLALAEKGTLVSNGNYKSVCKAINELPSVIPYGVTITDFADRCRECGRIKPCDDCISRQAVLDIINFEDKWLYDAKSHNSDTKIAFSGLKSSVKDLPSVTPTYDLEGYSTKLWKLAYERGKAESEEV